MTAKATSWLSLALLAGILLGGWLGVLIPGVMTVISFVGEGFLGIFTILSFFVVTTGFISAIVGLGDANKVKFAIFRNLGFYGATTLLGGGLGLGAGYLFRPSQSIAVGTLPTDSMAMLTGNGFWIGSVLFAAVFGLAIVSLKIRGRSLGTLVKNLHEGMSEVTTKLIYLAPIGLFSLAGSLVAKEGLDLSLFGSGAGQFVLAVVSGLAVYLLVILPVTLKLFSGQSIVSFYLNLWPAALVAMGTQSSRLALPFVAQAAVRDNHCDSRSTGLAVSLGSLFNVGPTLLVVLAATLFVSQGLGLALPFYTILLVALVATFLSIGLASSAGAVVPILALAFGLAGAPSAMIGGLAAISLVAWLVEPLRALANSFGEATAAAVLGESFEFKTALRTPSRSDPRRDRFSRDRSSSSSSRSGSSRSPRRSSDSTSSDRSRSPRDSGRSGSASERAPRRTTSSASGERSSRGRSGTERRPSESRPAPASIVKTSESRGSSEKSPFDIVAPGTPALELGQGADKGSTPSRTRQPRSRRDSEGRGRGRADRRESSSRESSSRDSSSTDSSSTDSSSRESSPRESSPRESSPRESSRRRQVSSRTRDHARSTQTAEAKSDSTVADSSSRTPGEQGGRTNEPSSPVSGSSGVTSTRARIEEDLARVSEQLKQMDSRLEAAPEIDSTPVDRSSRDDTPVNDRSAEVSLDVKEETRAPEPKASETESSGPDRSGFDSPEVEASEVRAPERDEVKAGSESESGSSNNGISDAEKQLAASFGRGTRKSRTRSEASEESSDADQAPAQTSSVVSSPEPGSPVAAAADSSEPAAVDEKAAQEAPKVIAPATSFGRTKRKKKLR